MERGLYTISVVLMVVACALGCSKLERGARAVKAPDEDERKVHYSEVVVYGNINANVTGDYPFSDMDGVYTIKFEVLCTYLGGEVPKIIYISGIGNANGQIEGCPAASIGNSKDALMFLKRTKKPDVFEVEFAPNIGDYYIILDDLTFVCGLTLHSNDELCDDFQPMTKEEDCQPFIPDKLEPTPEPTKGTTASVVDIEIDPEADGNPKGTNNQSDQGYDTKTDQSGKPVDAGEVRGDNGSAVVTTSIVLTLLNLLLAIVV